MPSDSVCDDAQSNKHASELEGLLKICSNNSLCVRCEHSRTKDKTVRHYQGPWAPQNPQYAIAVCICFEGKEYPSDTNSTDALKLSFCITFMVISVYHVIIKPAILAFNSASANPSREKEKKGKTGREKTLLCLQISTLPPSKNSSAT